MIKEAYVSYEIAKLLKEKGFDSDEVGCHGGFYSQRCYESGHGITTQSGQEVGIVYDDLTNSNLEYDEYLRPTHQMACAWLRERNICITPEIHITQDPKDYFWSATIFYLDKPWDIIQFVYEESKSISEGYDDVIEQAIKYSLENLI